MAFRSNQVGCLTGPAYRDEVVRCLCIAVFVRHRNCHPVGSVYVRIPSDKIRRISGSDHLGSDPIHGSLLSNPSQIVMSMVRSIEVDQIVAQFMPMLLKSIVISCQL
jgi:hypothetical protein